jgi:hypothetical protein
MDQLTADMMIVIPDTIDKQDIPVAERILSRNAERQYIETYLPAYENKNLERLPLTVGDYFFGYHPKSWLVPFNKEK